MARSPTASYPQTDPVAGPSSQTAVTLSRVLDDHVVWFSQWVASVQYPDETTVVLPATPESFAHWCYGGANGALTAQPAIDRLAASHDRLHHLARRLVVQSRDGYRPVAQDFRQVVDCFVDFSSQLRRIEKAFAVAESGLDPLTGLRSRAGMDDDLGREKARFDRTGQPFCIAICDIDRFKQINDRLGHDAGDKVLAGTAAAILRNVRSFDDVYRMGGEEFLICLKDAELVDGFVVVDRLRSEIATTPIDIGGGELVKLTASFGLVQAQAGVDLDDMIIMADKALYDAKNGGRNRVAHAGGETARVHPSLVAAGLRSIA